jgi:trans-L-3-hydroxyproline dehydratase
MRKPEFLKNWDYHPPKNWLRLKTFDMHTSGEPLRIVINGLPEIKGKTILEKRKYFKEKFDHLRTGLMFEPRGHADMYGAILTEPCSPDADLGVIFMHNEGYSTMCGHAILAITKLVLETGMIKKPRNDQNLIIDAPTGKIRSKATWENGKIVKTSFLNVPSFLYLKNGQIEIPGLGPVRFDIAFGGAFYAFCEASELGLELDRSNYQKLIDYGKKIKHEIASQFIIKHPFEDDLSFLYGTIFLGKANEPANHSRNVCIFADGEVDRSPTGSGISARAGLHYSKGEMELNKIYTIESIIGTTMDLEIVEECKFGPYHAVIPEVSGNAYVTGINEFLFDPDDPLNKGFILR